MANAHQSSDILSNSNETITTDTSIGNYNKSLAQKVSAGSKSTGKQTGNTSDRINNVIQFADPSVSRVDKNLNDVSGPSLELIGEYCRLKQVVLKQLPRPQFRFSP